MFVARADELETHPRLAGLGVEPLSPPLSGPQLRAALAQTRRDLKAALLDQSLIAGLGNIYVCEALHRAKLSPRAPAHLLTARQANRLAREIVATLNEAVEAGGSTLKDFSGADGAPGYFQHNFKVYDREGAACGHRGCRGKIARITQGGRSTFYCAACQPL
jgi:formamidopyrimidine-DNA glycosylase